MLYLTASISLLTHISFVICWIMLQVKSIHAAVIVLFFMIIQLKIEALLGRIFEIFVAKKSKSCV